MKGTVVQSQSILQLLPQRERHRRQGMGRHQHLECLEWFGAVCPICHLESE